MRFERRDCEPLTLAPTCVKLRFVQASRRGPALALRVAGCGVYLPADAESLDDAYIVDGAGATVEATVPPGRYRLVQVAEDGRSIPGAESAYVEVVRGEGDDEEGDEEGDASGPARCYSGDVMADTVRELTQVARGALEQLGQTVRAFAGMGMRPPEPPPTEAPPPAPPADMLSGFMAMLPDLIRAKNEAAAPPGAPAPAAEPAPDAGKQQVVDMLRGLGVTPEDLRKAGL